MDSLEPILAQKCNLSRAACPAELDAPPPAVPFAFFEISPRRISFLSEKGLAGGGAVALATWAAKGLAALGHDKDRLLLAHLPHQATSSANGLGLALSHHVADSRI